MSLKLKTILATCVPATLLATAASAAPTLATPNFGYDASAGSWRVERHPRMLADLNGDERADIVGFGNTGVWIALNDGQGHFGTPRLAMEGFGFAASAGSWRVDRHLRMMADLDGDDEDDIVGFGNSGVWVSLNGGDGDFEDPYLALDSFGYSASAGGWRVDRHPRMLADLTGDGRADIVGFGNSGVWIAINDGEGNFTAPRLAMQSFGYGASAGSWRIDRHPRMLADLDGDDRADLVGFGNAGMWVSLNGGNGQLQDPYLAVQSFGYGMSAGSWRVDRHPRMMADLTGDGRADIVGFGNAGMWIARNNGGGTFQPPQLALRSFGYDASAGSWRVSRHPRMTGEITGDDQADIVALGNAGVWTATNTGTGSFPAPTLAVMGFGYGPNAGSWRVDRHPRMLGDLDGDGRDELVGFGNAGVWVSSL